MSSCSSLSSSSSSQETRLELLFIEATTGREAGGVGVNRKLSMARRHLRATRLIEANSSSSSGGKITTNCPRKRTRTKHETSARAEANCTQANTSSCRLRRRRSRETKVVASQSSRCWPLAPSNKLLITIFICTFLATASANSANSEQLQLPTVIVRGFLNYRTTVDGTVLLFTPDAGQQASSTAAIQPTSTASLAIASPTVAAQQPQAPRSGSSSLVFRSSEREIEPTSVSFALSPLQTSHVDSSSFRRGQSPFGPPAGAHSIAESPEGPAAGTAATTTAAAAAAQANEWRPVQATPPLRMTAQPETEQPKPSVQADDLASQPPAASIESAPPAVALAESSRPKRPSLGFSGQGLRPRVPGTAGATSPSLQTRARLGGTTGGINGIRRPGLTTTATPTSASTNSATPSDPTALANAASAFQNRLASANTRLKNRFKHRQHTQPSDSTSGSASPSNSSHKPTNNLIAPESLLDVASSIEQPTSAARSAALAPSGTSGQLGASGPAVGSEEILAPIANAAAANVLGISPAASAADESPTGAVVTVPVAASGADEPSQPEQGEMGGGPLDQPMSAEQRAGSASLSRAGEQRPSSSDDHHDHHHHHQQQPRVLSGALQQGLLSSGPLQMDAPFQNDQPPGQLLSSSPSSSSSPGIDDAATPPALARATHKPRPALTKPTHHRPHSGNNEKLNGWLGAHHNKFVPRPAAGGKPGDSEPGHLSHALASNLNQLLPAQQPVTASQPPLALAAASAATAVTNASESMAAPLLATAASDSQSGAGSGNATTSGAGAGAGPNPNANATADAIAPMQTITRTYSTILETSKTRLVPMQLKSSTAIYTITEDYVMTKVMTAYQTLPAGAEFLLAEPALSTRAPYEIFEAPGPGSSSAESKPGQQQVVAPAPSSNGGGGGGGREAAAPIDTQEQPISLDTSSPKSANNWLHDFSSPDDPLLGATEGHLRSTQEQTMLALLEQQARGEQPNLSQLLGGGGGGGPNEPLDQLASQLDPAALLADGTINIPDLNNPLVLAAAIQNPQLAAVILAAQQLKLKQRQQQQQQQQLKPNQLGLQQLQQQLAQQQQLQLQLQPSYSTSFSTTVRPSTYVARDTMYTTRLVSFRDGRTVRTRTVSEPGSVIEQTLTTIVTETIPVTVTIKPTAVAGGLGGLGVPNTAALGQPGGQQQQSNQATINNALFATQLANILARRQQATQLQTSFQNPALMSLGGGGQNFAAGAAATPQQLLALQQLFARQKQQSQAQQQQQQQQPFQPNFNQLLASINQSNQQVGAANSSSSSGNAAANQQQQDARQLSQAASSRANNNQQADNQQTVQATPALQQLPKSVTSPAQDGHHHHQQQQQQLPQLNNNNINVGNLPITTTLTSLQVRTYTVHNAFKTIYRTITSTMLIPTVLSPGATLLPVLG